VIPTGRHPAVWKRATGVVICKPGKDDYTTLKAYRCISLLSCTGKEVDEVVVELCQKMPNNEGYCATDNLGAGRRGQPSTQRLSWLTELMQPGQTAT